MSKCTKELSNKISHMFIRYTGVPFVYRRDWTALLRWCHMVTKTFVVFYLSTYFTEHWHSKANDKRLEDKSRNWIGERTHWCNVMLANPVQHLSRKNEQNTIYPSLKKLLVCECMICGFLWIYVKRRQRKYHAYNGQL